MTQFSENSITRYSNLKIENRIEYYNKKIIEQEQKSKKNKKKIFSEFS